jgi:hypothetical protein
MLGGVLLYYTPGFGDATLISVSVPVTILLSFAVGIKIALR